MVYTLIIDFDNKAKTKVIVLKPQITESELKEIVDKKKTKYFRRMLKTPKSHEVHVHSSMLVYEPIMLISGKYSANFYRKASYEINVDSNVKELVFEDGVFPATNFTPSSSFATKLKNNSVSIKLEEHVFVSHEDELVIDHHGKIRDFKYKVHNNDIENYPKRILKKNTVKDFEITEEAAAKKLILSLQSHEKFDDVRDLQENMSIDRMTKVYIPIFEARLIGPKRKVEILRYDAVKRKLL